MILLLSASARRATRITATLLGLLAAPAAQSAYDGAGLFRPHCAACHGATGSGGVGVPLSLPDFLAIVDDDYLMKSIRIADPICELGARRALDARSARVGPPWVALRHDAQCVPQGVDAPADFG
jgi:hypothetical protein